MVSRNDVDRDNLLQQVIEHLRRQEIPEFPDPEIAVLKNVNNRRSSVRLSFMLRRMAMNRCFQLSAGAIVGLAVVLGFVLLWGGSVVPSASAMEKMAESIRKAKSFKAAVVLGVKSASKNATPSYQCRGTLFCLGTGSLRVDLKGNVPGESPGEHDETQLRIAGQSWIMFIDHKAKRVNKLKMPKREPNCLDIVQRLGAFSGRADRDLGVKEINGKKAYGFEIGMRKILAPSDAAMVGAPVVVEVWIDPESSLPVLVQFNYIMNFKRQATETLFFRMQDFQWNIDLNRKLFDTAIPIGYTDATPPESHPSQPLPADKRVQ